MGSKEQIAGVRIYSWLSGSVFVDRAAMIHFAKSLTMP
jgi:hypothetical protein